MKAFAMHLEAYRFIGFVAMTATLVAAGCDDPVTAPDVPLSYEHAQVSTDVYPDFASAGDDVWVEFAYANRGGGSALRATVTWNAARFRFVEAVGAADVDVEDGDPHDGWMSILAFAPELDDSGRVMLRFVALEDGDTSRIGADAILLSGGEPNGPNDDSIVW